MSAAPLKSLNIPLLLQRYGLKPHKSLGQNFLQEEHYLEEILRSACLEKTDAVLEIGAGLGSLTRMLACTAGSVTAVELDERIFPALSEVMRAFDNVSLIRGDILKLDPARLMGTADYVVVANIPYNITSILIRHLLEAEIRPDRMVLTVQKEVAQRICILDGKMSLLALSVWVYGNPQMGITIPADAFIPQPAVDSAILRVKVHPQPVIPVEDLKVFFTLVRAGFSQKRKTLKNSLAGGLRFTPPKAEEMLAAAGIDQQRRAETLSLNEWGNLVKVFHNFNPPR